MTSNQSLFLLCSVLAAVLSMAAILTRKVYSPMVQVNHGKVKGILLKSSQGREFYGYLGIPFAKPPIGPLRFMSPIPSDPWDGILDATSQKPMCPQLDIFITGFNFANFGSEDCLYLNVYTPKNMGHSRKFPVLAHIHGGYFHCGGTFMTTPYNFLNHDVIIVSLSYRLGALGFLSTGDEIVRGNMGLKDQQLALRWIQTNIESFGGDKSRVTLVGESAGAASIHFQMLSSASKGLFSRVIRQSGSSLNYWTVNRKSKEQAERFAKKFNCLIDSQVNLECLQAIDVHTLVEAHRDLMNIHPHNLIDKFVPTVEAIKDSDAFLTQEPITLLKSGQFKKVSVLSGMNRDEGLLHSTVYWANQTKLDGLKDFISWAPKALHYPPARKDISQKLKDFYFGKESMNLRSGNFIRNLTNLFGDRLFNFGIVQSAILEVKHNVPTYLYFYGHEGGFNVGTMVAASQSSTHPVFTILLDRIKFIWLTYILGKDYKPDVPGVSHADELKLLWGGSLLETKILHNRKDNELSKELVGLWVDWACNKETLRFRGVEFPPSIDNGTLQFLHINYDNPKMINEPFQKRRRFWEKILSSLE